LVAGSNPAGPTKCRTPESLEFFELNGITFEKFREIKMWIMKFRMAIRASQDTFFDFLLYSFKAPI
jgi:hypothetical protein